MTSYFIRRFLLIVPTFLSDPGDHRFTDQVRTLVQDLSMRLRRGSLVLFTSYQMLNAVYDGLREALRAAQRASSL